MNFFHRLKLLKSNTVRIVLRTCDDLKTTNYFQSSNLTSLKLFQVGNSFLFANFRRKTQNETQPLLTVTNTFSNFTLHLLSSTPTFFFHMPTRCQPLRKQHFDGRREKNFEGNKNILRDENSGLCGSDEKDTNIFLQMVKQM